MATVQRIFNPGVFKAGKSTHGWPAGLSRVWSSISRSSGTRTGAGQVPAVAKPGRSFGQRSAVNQLTASALMLCCRDSARSVIAAGLVHVALIVTADLGKIISHKNKGI